MKKIIIFISIILSTILIICFNTDKSRIIIVNGIKYKTTLNGSSVSSFPTGGNYEVTVECENAIGEWNYSKWVMEIYEITGSVSCNISFTSKNSVYLNDYIISLSGTTQGTGQVVNENGYRYEGKDPNNYIYFNNELWRIIGVFDSTSHGIANTNLVKIIRDNSIGGYGLDERNASTDWTKTDGIHLLNDYYYESLDATSSIYCGDISSCDYTAIGLKNNYRNMIQTVTWYLGQYDTVYGDWEVGKFYSGERSSTVAYGNTVSTTGNIGLMYASDYGYSVLASNCARTTNLTDYDSNSCAGKSWIVKYTEWTMTHRSSDYLFIIDYNGKIGFNNTRENFSVRPVVYLKSNVMILSGDGSVTNPYQIRLES